MVLKVALPVFEGPLDLLLHLIKQNKIDIYDIPIALITKQYLEYLELMRELNLEIASEFLVMAATLIFIKSKMLLPKDEQLPDEEDPRQELIEQLLEYEQFKDAAKTLRERYEFWSKAFLRQAKREEEFFLQDLSIFDLLTALQKILSKTEHKVNVPKETIKVEDKIDEILEILKVQKRLIFAQIFETRKNGKLSRLEIIVTFLALLEILRLRLARAYQESLFGDIVIELEGENGSLCDIRHP